MVAVWGSCLRVVGAHGEQHACAHVTCGLGCHHHPQWNPAFLTAFSWLTTWGELGQEAAGCAVPGFPAGAPAEKVQLEGVGATEARALPGVDTHCLALASVLPFMCLSSCASLGLVTAGRPSAGSQFELWDLPQVAPHLSASVL